jgi:hypothetical protein
VTGRAAMPLPALTLRSLVRFGLVVAGFALVTFGMLEWHDRRFSLTGFWPLDGSPQLHPLHILILGIAMIPAAVWEIFLLGHKHRTGPHPQPTDDEHP